MDSTLPGCIGYYGFPTAPNGPCAECPEKRLCRKTAEMKQRGG